MNVDLIQPASNLGVAGFAILILWWMYQSAAKERQRNDDRLDARDLKYNALEKEVRTEISAQLVASTTTLRDNMKIMEHVVASIKKK